MQNISPQLPRKKSVRFWDMPYEDTMIHNSDGEEVLPDFTPLRTGTFKRFAKVLTKSIMQQYMFDECVGGLQMTRTAF